MCAGAVLTVAPSGVAISTLDAKQFPQQGRSATRGEVEQGSRKPLLQHLLHVMEKTLSSSTDPPAVMCGMPGDDPWSSPS